MLQNECQSSYCCQITCYSTARQPAESSQTTPVAASVAGDSIFSCAQSSVFTGYTTQTAGCAAAATAADGAGYTHQLEIIA